MILTIKDICKTYDEKVAVDRLSLEVPEGRICGIIGPNGAGKTTTIRMVMNITMPDSGQILVDGRPRPDDFSNRVGYLPEERGLYPKMVVQEVVTYMAQLKGRTGSEISSEIDRWLALMNLSDYKNRKVEELSKGMQQKLQFITTLIHDPDLIILDELFSGLDPLNIELIKGVILDLKRRGKTILFSTHVMEQAEKLCDHICMISGGRKVIDGSLSEVKAQFGKNSLQIGMEGDGKFMADLDGVRKFREDNNYVELQLTEDANTDTLLKEISQRVSVRRFEIVEPSLYDIFIDMAKVDPDELEKGGEADHV